MSISKKISVLALAASLSLAASPMASKVALAEGNPGGLSDGALFSMMFFGMMFTSSGFLAAGMSERSEQSAQSLIDQAYAGTGEKLEILAGAYGKSVESVANAVVRLEQEGLISASNPQVMVQVVTEKLKK